MKHRKSPILREVDSIGGIGGADAIPKEPGDALVDFPPGAPIAVFDQRRVEHITAVWVLRVHIAFNDQLPVGYGSIIIGECAQVGFKIGAIVGGRVKGIGAISRSRREIERAIPAGGLVVRLFGRKRHAHGQNAPSIGLRRARGRTKRKSHKAREDRANASPNALWLANRSDAPRHFHVPNSC